MTSIIVPSSSDATTVLASAITVSITIILITVTIILMAINIIIRKRKSTILQHINDRYHSIIIIHKLLLLVSVSINVHSNSQSEKGQYYHRDHVTIACMISL